MMNNVEEYPLSFTSPSAVTFASQTDENDLTSKSTWNPDWTIQREISITIDKTVNDSPKLFSKKAQILSGIAISIALILSVIVPIMISTIDPHWPLASPRRTTTAIPATQIQSNSSTRKVEIYECENLIYIEHVNLIGSDLFSKSSMTWSTCCSWCLSISSCRAFTYETISSKCYLKSMINNNEIFDKGYQSAKYP